MNCNLRLWSRGFPFGRINLHGVWNVQSVGGVGGVAKGLDKECIIIYIIAGALVLPFVRIHLALKVNGHVSRAER